MTALIEMPGTLTSTAGHERVITTNNGFPDDNLASLYLFQDGAGTAPANSVSGGAAASITSVVSSSNAYAWLTGGGLDIEGGQVVRMPALDLRNPWTLVIGSVITGSVNDGTTRNYALISFTATSASNFRGAMLYLTGGTTWNPPVAPTNHVIRASDGTGTAATPTNMTPINQSTAIGTGRVRVLSYNGVDTVTGSIYDKLGNLLFTATIATNDTKMVTGASGVVQNTVQPILGPFAAAYCGGKQNIEAAAVYTRVLEQADIAAIAAKCAALASARGRAW